VEGRAHLALNEEASPFDSDAFRTNGCVLPREKRRTLLDLFGLKALKVRLYTCVCRCSRAKEAASAGADEENRE
jgi:hypothetical protein